MSKRREATLREKGEYADHFTVGELAAYLGVSKQTIERWEDSGKILSHSVRSKYGWKLWSPEAARKALADRKRGRI